MLLSHSQNEGQNENWKNRGKKEAVVVIVLKLVSVTFHLCIVIRENTW